MSNSFSKGQMNMFIQALYGVVLGVSLANFQFDGNIFKSHLTVSILDPSAIFDVTNSVEQRFHFFLLLFTTFITAHDWYIYHILSPDEPEKFWHYSFQITGLFFLAMMFNHSTYLDLRQWYMGALGYCGVNIVEVLVLRRGRGTFGVSLLKLVLYALLTILFIWPIIGSLSPNQDMDLYWFHTKWLMATIALVIILWASFDKSYIPKPSLKSFDEDFTTKNGIKIYTSLLTDSPLHDRLLKLRCYELIVTDKEKIPDALAKLQTEKLVSATTKDAVKSILESIIEDQKPKPVAAVIVAEVLKVKAEYLGAGGGASSSEAETKPSTDDQKGVPGPP